MFDEDPTLKDARLGIEANTFLSSNLGRELLKQSERMIEDAMQGLADVDPYDPPAIIQFQNQIKVGRSIPRWLVEMIQTGSVAEQRIQMEDAESSDI